MKPTLLYLLAVLISAIFWAKLEIEIEGAQGWAAGLPTWRLEKHRLLDWFYGGRPLTGYHVWAFSSVFFFFHLPFFLLHTWSWRLELHAVAGFALFWVVEDYLWFVLNPHFGWSKFKRAEVWWHKRWLLGLPVDYWVLGIFAALLFAV